MTEIEVVCAASGDGWVCTVRVREDGTTTEHEVAVRRADRKTFLHPRVGRLLMDCETLVTPDQGQQLVVLTPADTETRERLDLLRVLGIQEFPTGQTGPPAQ